MYVVNGLHFLTRVDYLLSRNPVPSGVCIQVHIPMSDEEAEP